MEQLNHELYENARRRIKQKKLLFIHFVVFCVAAIFMLFLDKVLGKWPNYTNWSYWVILIWAFVFTLHFVNVFITKRFMNKQWEREEIDKLVERQKRRIEQLQKKVDQQYPIDNSIDNTTNL